MDPIDKRNYTYISILGFLALSAIITGIVINPYFIIILILLTALSFMNTLQIKHRFILLAAYAAIGFPVLLIADNYLAVALKEYDTEPFEILMLKLFFSAAILILPYSFINTFLTLTIDTAINEKKHYAVFKNYPYLICRKHHVRTNEYKMLGYRGVRCRSGKNCTKKGDIAHAVNLVGVIGLIENGNTSGSDYYVTLWDHRQRKIRYGDYDVIEIHKNEEIKDYDFVISKIITFFNNEIDRLKPLNKVAVRIIGDPQISENSKRILENNFLHVEYIPLLKS